MGRRLLRRLACAVLAGAAMVVHAAMGDIDPTFATRGLYTPPPECCGAAGATAVAIQPDGKTLLGGFASRDGPWEAVVVRLNADGTQDNGFGVSGVARVAIPDGYAEVRSVAVQADGKIVAGGLIRDASDQVRRSFVLRLDAAGRLDSSFDGRGYTVVGPLVAGATSAIVRRVLLQPDGKIVVVGGVVLRDGSRDTFAARLNASGALDASFGSSGVTLSRLVDSDEGFDGVIAADGSIFVVGTATLTGSTYGVLMKLRPDGQGDATFDGDGVKAPVFNFSATLQAIALQADGRILLGGRLTSATVFRLLPTAELDTSYGNSGAAGFSGRMTVDRIVMQPSGQALALLQTTASAAQAVRINADGMQDSGWTAGATPTGRVRDGRVGDLAHAGGLTVVATSGLNASSFMPESFRAVRYTANGGVDASFAGGTYVARLGLTLPIGRFPFLAVTPTGAIVTARLDATNSSLLLTRLTPDGREDPAFGRGGRAAHPAAGRTGPLIVKPNGKLVLALEIADRAYQFNADGSLDGGFAQVSIGGILASPYLAAYPDNRFILGNASSVGRLLDSGAHDPTFGFGRPVEIQSSTGVWVHGAVMPNGGVALAGDRYHSVGFVEMREPNGGIDFSFGVNGRALFPPTQNFTVVLRVAAQPDGRIVAMGIDARRGTSPGTDANTIFVARLLPNGLFDPQFGNAGVTRGLALGAGSWPQGLALQPDGKILVTGVESGSGATPRGFVWRVNADGTPDSGFGQLAGVAFIDSSPNVERGYAVAVQPNGGIVVAGSYNETNFFTTFNPAVWRLFGTLEGSGGPAGSLVSSYYRTILGRDADPAGQTFWEGEVSRLGSLGASASEAFYVMAATFFGSAEYAQRNTTTTQFITDLYRTFFQRDPDGAGLDFWAAQASGGRPREAILNEFLFSIEFANFMNRLFGSANASRPAISMAMDFYRGILHRLPDSSGLSFWSDRLRSAACTGTVANEADTISGLFFGSQEYANRQAALPNQAARNEAFVLDLYSAFMRRGAETEGFRFFVDQLNSGAQSREQIRRQFVASAEFQARVQAVQSQGCT